MSVLFPDDSPATTDELAAPAREVARKLGDHLSVPANYLRDTGASARYHSEDFIRNNPWPAIGIAVGFGFLLGVAAARR